MVVMLRKRSKVRVCRLRSGGVLVVVLANGQFAAAVGRARVVCLVHGGGLLVVVVVTIAFGRVRCHGGESHDEVAQAQVWQRRM